MTTPRPGRHARPHTRTIDAGMELIQLAEAVLDTIGLLGRRDFIAALNAKARQILINRPEATLCNPQLNRAMIAEVDADIAREPVGTDEPRTPGALFRAMCAAHNEYVSGAASADELAEAVVNFTDALQVKDLP